MSRSTRPSVISCARMTQRAEYQKLIETAEHMVQQATRVVEALSQQPEAQAKRLFTQAEEVLPLVKRVIVQTRSRVLEGKHVPSDRDQCSVSSSRTRPRFPRTKAAPTPNSR